jgi:hypothetical protein
VREVMWWPETAVAATHPPESEGENLDESFYASASVSASSPEPMRIEPLLPSSLVFAPPREQTPEIRLAALTRDVPLPRPGPPADIRMAEPLKTPAQRLELEGKERAKQEHCLAVAIYFEARNQAVRGQIAVAQVVLNRVFSPFYPDTVCGVVYQGAHRFLSCQFTFACDGKSKALRDRGSWARARRIARQMLDGQLWLAEVGKSTHYHANYVSPYWVREMKKFVRYGAHIFYRPRKWGDGAEEFVWGKGATADAKGEKTARVTR